MKNHLLTLLLIGTVGVSCGPTSASRLHSEQFDMKSVFVVGTWGRDGSDDGVDQIVRRIREALTPSGVPAENIYSQPWSRNKQSDDLPGDAPSTDTHIQRLRTQVQAMGLEQPGYLGLFGHSFGGWATARISTTWQGHQPDAVFLLDPVVMLGYRDRPQEKTVSARFGKSFFQEESIIDIDPCVSGDLIDIGSYGLLRCDVNSNASCGQSFRGLTEGNEKVRYKREADGAIKKINCSVVGRKKVPTSHVSMDNDGFLQEFIIAKIKQDVLDLKNGGITREFSWQELPGRASAIGVFDVDHAAVLGMGNVDNGIYQWNFSDWIEVSGAATAVDVGPDGSIWVVNSAGGIYRNQGQGFYQLPGLASDISVGADGSAWVISLVNDDIYRWNGSDWNHVPGKAHRISVGPDGNPVVVNSGGGIYRYNGRGFELMPGSARDVGVGADGSIWIIGSEANPWGYEIQRWNTDHWQRLEGGGIGIDVDNLGQPWIVNNVGGIYKANRR